MTATTEQLYGVSLEDFLSAYHDDPLLVGQKLWPNNKFADYQQKIILSVWQDDETVVPAANMMGA